VRALQELVPGPSTLEPVEPAFNSACQPGLFYSPAIQEKVQCEHQQGDHHQYRAYPTNASATVPPPY